ncbi:MAG TPA: acyl-ACP--UDP-N-acetylglucosamine O-acyltransferase [Labilithrix sp.]|nr:acyl-ACP--UDP-N-acetylglucosamine O-acyltransferase [Labilithrix sp.]
MTSRGAPSRIHATAVVDPRAELAADVEIGPYSVVGPGVRIDAGTRLHSHVVIGGHTSIGTGNVFHPFSVIGGDPQIRKLVHGQTSEAMSASPVRGALVIGADNVFREHVTVSLSSGEKATTIGAKNLFMAGAHVAHDVTVGSHCVVANAVQLAGHVTVEDWVTFGGLSGVAQWLRVGESAFVAAGAMCERDVPPFVIVQGDRARVRALNVIGLERRGLPASSIALLKRAFARTFVRRASGVSFDDAVRDLDRSDPLVDSFARALAGEGGSAALELPGRR